jgi:hypothetical protein
MKRNRLLMSIAAVTALLVGIAVKPAVRAGDDGRDSTDARIQIGLDIAPVTLNLNGKNRDLVGLGSYLVNAVGDCNVCHNALPGPSGQYVKGGNPYFGQPKNIDQTTYLGGGRDFGPLVPGNTAHIISRNLTPDVTGRPVGGQTFDEFLHILRTGEDPDHLHPTCTNALQTDCVPPPFDGNLLQIMPWPVFQDMTWRDIRAIYEYLRAIPCVAGPPAPSTLHNQCF